MYISLFLFHVFILLSDVVRKNIIYTRVNKKRINVQEKKVSCERASKFDQWKTFPKSYKAMRVLLWLVYKLDN